MCFSGTLLQEELLCSRRVIQEFERDVTVVHFAYSRIPHLPSSPRMRKVVPHYILLQRIILPGLGPHGQLSFVTESASWLVLPKLLWNDSHGTIQGYLRSHAYLWESIYKQAVTIYRMKSNSKSKCIFKPVAPSLRCAVRKRRRKCALKNLLTARACTSCS